MTMDHIKNLMQILLGSNVAYDESMNLRNILWLAPLPCNVTKAWLAPGSLSQHIFNIISYVTSMCLTFSMISTKY